MNEYAYIICIYISMCMCLHYIQYTIYYTIYNILYNILYNTHLHTGIYNHVYIWPELWPAALTIGADCGTIGTIGTIDNRWQSQSINKSVPMFHDEIVFLVTRLLIFWSSLSWLLRALVANLSAFRCHMLALPPDRKGFSRLWVPLFGMAFPLNFVLCRGTFSVLFINSSRLSSLAEPGSASE